MEVWIYINSQSLMFGSKLTWLVFWTSLFLFCFCYFFTSPGYLPFFFKFLPRVLTFFSCATLFGFTAVTEIWGKKFHLAEFATGEPTEISGPKVFFQQFQYSLTRLYFDRLKALLPTVAILPIILSLKTSKILKHSIYRFFRAWANIWLSIFKLFVQLREDSIDWLIAA